MTRKQIEALEPGGHAALVDATKAYVADAIEPLALALKGTVVAVADWDAIVEMVATGKGRDALPVGTQFGVPWSTTGTTKTDYPSMPWDVVHYKSNLVSGGESAIPLMYLQSHHCLPDGTQFSASQAFAYLIDGLPAGTYNVTVPATYASREAGDYQFTLASAAPAGAQLAGFWKDGGVAAVTVFASQTATTATETCAVTSGSAGTSLGSFSAAGVAVPASGTPDTKQSVTIDGTTYEYYGLNSQQRVAYGNNRWLHSAVRQWLNASGDDWWEPQTVFDRPPSYVSHKGFLTYLDPELVAVMRPVVRKYALNYGTDGGTSSAPEYDTCADKVFLPTWEEHYLAVNSSYGGVAGQEGCGEAWDYWKAASGASNPPAAGSTVTQYITTILGSGSAASVWVSSCLRYSGHYVASVTSSGGCGNGGAYDGYRCAPACAIG